MNNAEVAGAAVAAPNPVPWRRGLVWLLFLGPFFFLSYGFANHLAAQRGVSESLFFGWERQIPFVPWTILPYWSIDLFYGLSFLTCATHRQVDRHAFRLITAQVISVVCFLLFPLRFAFDRPATDGLFGRLFDLLMGFDQPYNQAPSLHISLLVILWWRFAAAASPRWSLLVHVWSALIAVSVLTTFQHHFIDIPTGALVGFLCLWLWPEQGRSPLTAWRLSDSAKRQRLAGAYLLGAGLFAGLAVWFGGSGLWLGWATVALGLVAAAYLGLGAAVFQKQDGRHSVAAGVLLAPYVVAAWLNSRWWTRRRPAPSVIADGVWLGRLPTADDMRRGGFAALFDLTAELPAPSGEWRYDHLPWLDLVPPRTAELAVAAERIEALRRPGPLLVCCALGYSRSASAVAAWLLRTGRADSVAAAEAVLRVQRPEIVIAPAHRAALAGLLVPHPEVSHG